MGAKWKAATAIILFGISVCAVFGFWKYQEVDKKEDRIWHHELAAGADPTLGSDTIPEDYMVDESFTSHLPLVIIDTGGEEIVNYKYFDSESQSFRYTDGVDPYVKMQISLIDNENMVNHLGDVPSEVSYGKMKIRGNTSSSQTYPKKQYLIKLLTEDEEPNIVGMLGMTASDTWILNGPQLDKSYLRNYISMNTAGEISAYTPDIRFCEMVLKKGDKYEYMGLYGLYEKIERGEGRLELDKNSGYLLLRDRLDPDVLHMPVWSTEHKNKYNWINLEYPSSERITQQQWSSIQNDIRKVEDCLYSSDRNQFLEYRSLLDIDSFVDYFIINEFFTNYDAGWNSTFLYKDRDGKIHIGPFWDFDGAMDNYPKELLKADEIVLQDAPWFDKLVTDQYFVKKLTARYEELRKSILSRSTIESRIDAAARFIEKPAERDISRWSKEYHNPMPLIEEKATGLEIDRNRGTWEDELQRVKDTIRQHGNFLDHNITDLYYFVEEEKNNTLNTLLGSYFIIAFFVSIILVQRAREGLR